MKAKLVALNVLLAAALGVVVWQAYGSWKEAQLKRRHDLSVKLKPLPAPSLAAATKPEAAPATKFADVAMKDLFSKDRNPNIVVAPPTVAPPKPMPPLPVVFGVLGLPSGTKAIMAEKAGLPSRPVRQGDKIGEFTIAALDPENVTFDWDGKEISKKIDDLIDRSTGPGAASAGASTAANANAPAAAKPAPQPSNVKGGPGKDTGGGTRACVPGDSSPSGTVAEGYTKHVVKSAFGDICNWTQVQ